MTDIFVFGSNLAGRHGKGAAKHALDHHGAVYGQGWGLQGASFGIPTKDGKLNTLSVQNIQFYVDQFRAFASAAPGLTFNVTLIGCGLAGYTPKDIGPLFHSMPPNVKLPPEFEAVLRERRA